MDTTSTGPLAEKPQPERTTEQGVKLARVRTLLERRNLEAVLLSQTANFAWATCGADSHVNTALSTGVASVMITQAEHFILTNNIESSRLMEEQGLAAQGWELKVVPWYASGSQVAELTAGMKLGADAPTNGAVDISHEMGLVRSQLTSEEGRRFRLLGKSCAEAMQEAIDGTKPGLTEFEIAGLLAQAAEKRGTQAVVNLIAADERVFAYRHPLPTSRRLRNYAMLVLCGRQWGLICSITRLVYFGRLPVDLRRKGQAVAQIDAAMISATRPGTSLGDVFKRAQQEYAAAGFPDEWKYHHQGGSAGYAPREVTAGPSSTETILLGQAYAWNPSITGAKSEDTILVTEDTNEIITQMTEWPSTDVEVDGRVVSRPAILERT